MPAPNLKGRRFGRLVVIERHPINTPARKAQWECRCDCGNRHIAVAGSLMSGHTVSCGCHKCDLGKVRLSTHGLSRTPEYSHWKAMIKRCENPNDSSFARYGGKGVSVCERWRSSFPDFLLDMGRRPSEKHTVDRIDSAGNYEPSNCRWATPLEQARNTSRNVRITYRGETRTFSEWCEISDLPRTAVVARLRRGWSFDSAITTRLHRQVSE